MDKIVELGSGLKLVYKNHRRSRTDSGRAQAMRYEALMRGAIQRKFPEFEWDYVMIVKD